MKPKVLHKRSNSTISGGGALVPASSALSYGEIAINYKDGKETLFIKNDSDEVVAFESGEHVWERGTGENSVQQKGTGAVASGVCAVAEGVSTTASGVSSHAEGNLSIALGKYSHAEGNKAQALGDGSHAEGVEYNEIGTSAMADAAHAEGAGVVVKGQAAHGEGLLNVAGRTQEAAVAALADFPNLSGTTEQKVSKLIGFASHSEGSSTQALGTSSHAEGNSTQALVNATHAEGDTTTASGEAAHSEGYKTTASGNQSHSEGFNTQATANQAHSEGKKTIASAENAHSEGNETKAVGNASHSEGYRTYAYGAMSHIEGTSSTLVSDANAASESVESIWEENGHNFSLSRGQGSHVEGKNCLATGDWSHAEGVSSSATKIGSHAEGSGVASGYYAHAEGNSTVASGGYSHAEGSSTRASNTDSHAEGSSTMASGLNSHAEGGSTIASGINSHAEGYYTKPSGSNSHAEGDSTTAQNKSEHAEGQYNVSNKANSTFGDAGNTIHSVGIGTSSQRKNAFEIMQNGDAYLYGVGGYSGTTIGTGISTLQKCVGKMQEITWSALKSLRDSSGLTPGMQYRITDYNTTTTQANTQAAGHQFDIIVVADSVNKLNENARAIRHSGDTYFSGSTLEAWELKYDIDNDTAKFAWADSGATGRGVIYYMKDEWNNECPYDFKNIQFARWEQTTPVGYVFDEDEWDYVQDSDQSWVSGYNLKAGFYSLDGNSNDVMLFYNEDLADYRKKISYTVSSTPTYCYTFGRGLDTSLGKVYDNVIKEYYKSNKLQLNNIVFLQTTLSQNCYSNTFGSNCHNNTFGNNCRSNTFGNDCGSNTFGIYCNFNTFGNDCNFNTFGNSCYSNTFGYGCNFNTFGDSCNFNTFGNSCYSNTFGYDCHSNTFGISCYSNTFGNYYESNTFGNSCYSNTFGYDCESNTFGDGCNSNTFGNYCRFNTFGESVQYFITGNATGATTSAQTNDYIQYLIVENGVQNVNAYCTGTTSSSNYCQNIKIGLGLKGTSSSNRLQIDITQQIGATASVTYQPANSQVISV